MAGYQRCGIETFLSYGCPCLPIYIRELFQFEVEFKVFESVGEDKPLLNTVRLGRSSLGEYVLFEFSSETLWDEAISANAGPLLGVTSGVLSCMLSNVVSVLTTFSF